MNVLLALPGSEKIGTLSSRSRDILPQAGLSSSAEPWDRRGRKGGNDSSLAVRPERGGVTTQHDRVLST